MCINGRFLKKISVYIFLIFFGRVFGKISKQSVMNSFQRLSNNSSKLWMISFCQEYLVTMISLYPRSSHLALCHLINLLIHSYALSGHVRLEIYADDGQRQSRPVWSTNHETARTWVSTELTNQIRERFQVRRHLNFI